MATSGVILKLEAASAESKEKKSNKSDRPKSSCFTFSGKELKSPASKKLEIDLLYNKYKFKKLIIEANEENIVELNSLPMTTADQFSKALKDINIKFQEKINRIRAEQEVKLQEINANYKADREKLNKAAEERYAHHIETFYKKECDRIENEYGPVIKLEAPRRR